MFDHLERITKRPKPFEQYSASELWTDEYTSQKMLSFHLNGDIDVSSRNTAFINCSTEWIIAKFKIGPGVKVADFGCGPGLYTTRLARTQAEITGIDFSQRSIQYTREVAKSEGLNINYVCQDYLGFDTSDRFDLILMIMCDYCALSPVQRRDMLKKWLTLLKPGGSVLFDVYSLKAFVCKEEKTSFEINLLDGFWSPNKYYGFLNTFKYKNQKVILDKYTIIEADRIRTVYNWLQYFSPDSLERELKDNGFMIQSIFSDVAGTPFEPDGYEFAVIARLL
jgi:SAM-dependent methyltransferase